MKPRVVIVGAGFGGLYAARALAGAPVDVTVLDQRNHHLFQPLLYQVATATLNPSDIAVPIRSVLRRQKNARVLLGDVTAVEAGARRVRLADGTTVPYDFLVLATGATHSYFGHDAWAPLAPGLKDLEDALEIRKRIFLAFEAAERETDTAERRAWMTFVLIGAGPTGVELAGALAEIARQSLSGHFRSIDPRAARIVLVEGLPRPLPTYPEKLSAKARARLDRLGIDVRTGERVTAIDERGVRIGAERIEARTVIWAAGVAASPLARSLGVRLDASGRVPVSPDLRVPGHADMFVVGDLAAVRGAAAVQDAGDDRTAVQAATALVPGVAPAAMQEGRSAARNIQRLVAGQPTRPFRYFDKGPFAVIGRGAAVAHLFEKVPLWGFPAWILWIFIHLFFLIGFRNRLLVLIDWAYSYVTFRRGAQLITGEADVDRLLAETHERRAVGEGRPT